MAKNEVKIVITGDAARFKKSLGEAETGMAAFSTKMEAAGARMRQIGSTLTTSLTLPIVGAGVVATKWAMDAEEAANKVNVVFGDSAVFINHWAKTATTAFGMSKGQAMDAFGTIGTMLRGFGIETAKLPTMSNDILKLAADLGSFHNLNTAEVLDMISASFRGEFDSIQRVIPTINAAAVETKALAMTGKTNAKALTDQEKAMATYALLLEGAGPAVGDFERTQDSATNKTKIATANFREAAETLGQKLLPIVTRIADAAIKLVDAFDKLSPTMQTVILIGLGVLAALGPIVSIAGAVATAIGFIASPVGLVVAALVGLGVALVALYKNNEGFRTWVNDTARSIRDNLGKAFEYFKDKILPKLKAAWQDFVDNVWPKVVTAFNYLKDEVLPKVINGLRTFVDGAQTAFTRVKQYVTSFVGWLNTYVVPTVQAIVRALVAAWQLYWSMTGPIFKMIAMTISAAFQIIGAYLRVFVQMFVGLWNGLWQMVSGIVAAVWNGIKGNIQAGLQMIRGIMDIFSGILTGNWSRAWEGVKNVVGGSINGILSTLRMFVDIGRSILGGLITWIQAAFSGIANFILVPFRLAVGGFKSLWNSTIGGKGFSLPSWVPGIGGKEFRIPTLHTGGIVPGPVGKDVLANLQAGEMVLSLAQVDALARGRSVQSAGGATVINVTVNAGVGDAAEIGRKTVEAIKAYESRNGASWRVA